MTGGPPALLAVHYVGRLADSGEVFMDTRMESQTEEPEEVVAGRGEWARSPGWSFPATGGGGRRAVLVELCPAAGMLPR